MPSLRDSSPPTPLFLHTCVPALAIGKWFGLGLPSYLTIVLSPCMVSSTPISLLVIPIFISSAQISPLSLRPLCPVAF